MVTYKQCRPLENCAGNRFFEDSQVTDASLFLLSFNCE